MIKLMPVGRELKITKELVNAHDEIREAGLAASDPIAVLALSRYIDALAKGYGLSEHRDVTDDPLVLARRSVPKPATDLIQQLLPESRASNADGVRDRLYNVLAELARQRRVPEFVDDVLALGQIYWNLTRTDERPRLPIPDKQEIKIDGKPQVANIRVPRADKDFAQMKWKDRTEVRGAYSSSGGGLRKQGARLSVLAANHIVEHASGSAALQSVGDARLQLGPEGTGVSIVWDADNQAPVIAQRRDDPGTQPAADHQSVVEHSFARLKIAGGFEGRDAELGLLRAFCTGPEERLLVVGDRFSGKSALMAEFFVNADLPDVVRLGYFVPPNHRQDARYEAMVRDLVRQAYRLTEGYELSAEASDNPGVLRDLLSGLVARASAEHRTVVLVVDGIDEDVSDRYGARTMMSVLNSLSSPGLKVILSGWTDRIPEEAIGWRRLEIQRTADVAENLRQMETELGLLFDDDSARGILQYLTFGTGAFGADELAELLDTSVRSIRKVLTGSDSRVFSSVSGPGEHDRWAFAHLKFADIARGLFADSPGIGELAETETAVHIEDWACSYRDRGWPSETPRYLLAQYPELLADRGASTEVCGLLFDAAYLRAVATRFGPANPLPVLADQVLLLALRALRDNEDAAPLETIAKLVTVRDNYRFDAGTVPLLLLEAVGRVSGQAAARTLATQIIKRDLDYDPDEVRNHADPFEPLRRSDAAVVTALVRAGLRDMASNYTSNRNSREVEEAYAQALLNQGDREGAIGVAHAWRRSIEEAAQEDQHTIDAYLEHYERSAERLMQAPDEDLSLLSGSLSEVALSVMASDEGWFPSQAPSVLDAYENFRRRARCVRLLRDAGDESSASSLALRLLAAYNAAGQLRSAVAIEVAAALVWGGHSSEAWEVVNAIPEVLVADVPEEVVQDYPGDLVTEALATVMTLRGRPGIADHPFLHPGAGVLDLVRRAPVLPLIEAFKAAGDRDAASKILNDFTRGTEYAQVHAALVVRVGEPDEALAAIQALETLPDDSPGLEASTTFSVAWHMVALLALLAREHPDSQVADHAVDQIKSLITKAHPDARPVLLNQLANALMALGRDDEFDSIVDQVDDPADALLRAVEAAARRRDLQTAARYAGHPLWQRPSTSVKQHIPALSHLAICHEDAGDSEQAVAAISDALALAASPAVVTSARYREVMDAAASLAFNWERMLRQGLRPGIETIGAAANWLEEPQDHLHALQEATIATVKLWMRSRGIPEPSADEGTDVQQEHVPDDGRRIEAMIGGQAPAGWEGWTQVFAALGTALDRAGYDASSPFQVAFRAALDERIFDNPGKPSPPIALGYLLTTIARLGIQLEPDELQRVDEALEESRQRLHNSLTFTVKRRGASALWAAAESMSRAAVGQQGDARALLVEATDVIASSEPTDLAANDRDFGLCWCVKTLTFLGDADAAVPLLGYISGAIAAAQANYSLASAYLDKGDRTRATHHAARALSEYVDPAILRQLDPGLVPRIAAFEKLLARCN